MADLPTLSQRLSIVLGNEEWRDWSDEAVGAATVMLMALDGEVELLQDRLDAIEELAHKHLDTDAIELPMSPLAVLALVHHPSPAASGGASDG